MKINLREIEGSCHACDPVEPAAHADDILALIAVARAARKVERELLDSDLWAKHTDHFEALVAALARFTDEEPT